MLLCQRLLTDVEALLPHLVEGELSRDQILHRPAKHTHGRGHFCGRVGSIFVLKDGPLKGVRVEIGIAIDIACQ